MIKHIDFIPFLVVYICNSYKYKKFKKNKTNQEYYVRNNKL